MLRATGRPGATPGESVPTKDAPHFRSGRVTHPIGHDTGWTTARSLDEVGTSSAQERRYSPVMTVLFLPDPLEIPPVAPMLGERVQPGLWVGIVNLW